MYHIVANIKAAVEWVDSGLFENLFEVILVPLILPITNSKCCEMVIWITFWKLDKKEETPHQKGETILFRFNP